MVDSLMITEMTILLKMFWKGQVDLVLSKQMKTMIMMSSSSIQGNQKLKLALDGERLDNKEEDDFKVDAIEDDDERQQYTE